MQVVYKERYYEFILDLVAATSHEDRSGCL